ncbi:MAG TPA: hypothetical protein VIN05_00670 [Roseovarius sp.]
MIARIKSIVGRKTEKRSKPNFSVPAGEAIPPHQEPTPLLQAKPPSAAFPIESLTPKLRSAAEAIMQKTQGPAVNRHAKLTHLGGL